MPIATYKMHKKTQTGFTLVELLMAVIVIGVVTMIMSPMYSELATSQRLAYVEKHRLNNQMIVTGLMSYAANSTALGDLPAPYTGSGYTKTVYNTASATLADALQQTGISVSEINDDGTAAKRVRAYQLVTSIGAAVPLYFQSGPLATVKFSYGAVYLTDCQKTDTATCNPTPATGLPGTSTVLTSANYTTWTTGGTDGVPTFISSLPIQKQMLSTTTQRLDKVRDSLLSYFRTQQLTAAASTATNWYPNDSGVSAAGTKTGQNPATTQDCRDGWYNLSTTTAILNAVGLSSQEFGTTAWGGAIEYCRDYDPANTSANSAPHYAAIRINKSVTDGIAPSTIPTNNIVLTF